MYSEIIPITSLPGVGKHTAALLNRLNIYSIQDLLLHLPSRYQNRSFVTEIADVKINQEVVVEGHLQSVSMPTRGRTKLLCVLKDTTGTITLRFFHAHAFMKAKLKEGATLRCYAEIRLGPSGFEMVHPECQTLDEVKKLPLETHLTAIYPTTEGLSQNQLRKLVNLALAYFDNHILFHELIPTSLQMLTLKDALYFLHKPPTEIPLEELATFKTPAQKRLAFEELLTHRISLLKVKKIFQSQISFNIDNQNAIIKKFLESLPFKLTKAQQNVIKEIESDFLQNVPMLRLVQGDVGSGKTIVAAFAALQVISNNLQVAMMAPTELLAEQHYRVFKNWFEMLGINVVYLSSQVKGRTRMDVLSAIQCGSAQLIIGTHALFQTSVLFSKLALIIIDEHHRFGVMQRSLLREKGEQNQYFPHQLILTATPIPRTLAMSLYADLNCSIIDELPPGRTPIVTSILANEKRAHLIERIREKCSLGHQTYWVCPLIDESDIIQCQSAIGTKEQLQDLIPEVKVGLIHGRMPSSDKESMMADFIAKKYHILVATTVIEVGVDVPNASLMVIENAERLGLSQLHQLRGRVGRGTIASHCILLYQQPLSDIAKSRLTIMRETTDGFKIAEQDLVLRGPGEILGTKQTGELNFKIVDLIRDQALLPDVNIVAEAIFNDHPGLIEQLEKRWLSNQNQNHLD